MLVKKNGWGKFLKPLAIVLFIGFSYTYASGQTLNLTVPMSAAQEVPPMATAGIGTGNLTFNPVDQYPERNQLFSADFQLRRLQGISTREHWE